MILHCTFEEITAANASAERVLGAAETGGVAAPPEVIADIEALTARLDGDIDVESLHELRRLTRAAEYLLADAKGRTDAFILEQSPSAESAILSYFEYAHLLSIVNRAGRLADQMAILIEVMTGQPVTEQTARTFAFPE